MTTPAPQVWPTLRARDARALIRFLVDAFGFEETAVHADGDTVHHAELAWPLGGGVMLGSVRPDGSADQWALQPGTFGAYVVTDDPDALHARVAGRRRRDHQRTARHRLRLARLRRAGPRGQPVVLRHLPRRAPQVLKRALHTRGGGAGDGNRTRTISLED